ncbi:hypothetical protein BRC82_02445 [Halobacteriales archaeon QS_1_67_19]|nr:MAG: hypothetical protein BRC82_02445 [Halobacteriales archaeon QS_1_67_19]
MRILDGQLFSNAVKAFDQASRLRRPPRAPDRCCQSIEERDDRADGVGLPEVDDDDVGIGVFREPAMDE